MKQNIALIDFGAGNLHSVNKVFKFIGADVDITNDPKVIEKSDAVVFPGVGAFGTAIYSIRKYNLEDIVINQANGKKPFLGICLGMQVLFSVSEEDPEVKGLGVFKGKVVRFKKAKRVPHIGWNQVNFRVSSFEFRVPALFYFAHSYYVVPEDENIIYAETEYDGEIFTSVVKKENLLLVQFHPEKSGEAGLRLLEGFVKDL